MRFIRTIFAVGVCVIAVLAVGGCKDTTDPGSAIWGTETKNDDGTRKFRVLTTIVPLFCFTANIAEPYCEVRCLLTNRGAHGYESSIQDNRAVSTADLIIANGLGMDGFIRRLRDQSTNHKVKIIWTAEEIKDRGAKYIEGKPIDHGDHVHPGGPDMHVWLGNAEAKLQCLVICDALCDLDPAHKEHYRRQTEIFLEQLDQLARDAEELKTLPGRIITFHDSFRYFARSYLGDPEKRIAGVIAGQEGEEVGSRERARQIEDIISQEAEYGRVRVIGVEPQYSERPARTLQTELNRKYGQDYVRIIKLDPLETAEPDPERPFYVKKSAYIDVVRGNIERLKEALRP